MDTIITLADAIASGLAVVAFGEMVAAQFFSMQATVQSRLIASLLLWEGFAMFACAFILHFRQEFGFSTIVALVAIWMAGAGIGLLRAGFFDAPHE